MTEMETVVQLEHEGRRYTFRVDHDPPLAFWRVECEGRVYLTPMRVMGGEEPEFFRGIVEAAMKHGEL